MQYRQLGKTNLTVSEVGFGVWTVATNWWGKIEPADGVKLLQEAVGLGVTLFDTADTYSEGFGEEILAKAIGSNRHDVVYATKFGYDIYNAVPREGHRERPQDFSPDFIRLPASKASAASTRTTSTSTRCTTPASPPSNATRSSTRWRNW